jgi:hypothetical protein
VLNLIANTVDLVRAAFEEILVHLSREARVADTPQPHPSGRRSA